MRIRLFHRILVAIVATTALAPASAAVAVPPEPRTFTAPLSGAQEVPAVETLARGNVVLHLSEDGSSLDYRLMVANIQNVTQAHIHLAPAGANGSVVAWLYPSAPPAQLLPGRTSGVVATGTITAAQLVGPLAGASLEELVDEIRSGNAYVNVHTTQHPPGEIRCQL
jgi:hypothetical protein